MTFILFGQEPQEYSGLKADGVLNDYSELEGIVLGDI